MVDPEAKKPLRLTPYRVEGEEIIEGVLAAAERWYPVLDGVPRILLPESAGDYSDFAGKHKLIPQKGALERTTLPAEQQRTVDTFSDKWLRFQNYGFEAAHQKFLFEWYQKKLGLNSFDELCRFYQHRRMILEVGPGSGFNTKFMAEHTQGQVFAADISEAASVSYKNTRGLPNCHVIQADLSKLPFPDESFDLIMADGVLHHTPDTRAAVEALYRKLAPGGDFFFYIYRRMGTVRRHCDEVIRGKFTQLSAGDCYKACEAFTNFGHELSKLNAKITLDKPIDVLEIPAGTYDLQRLIHYYFMKCFWNDAFDYETNNMVNFDWYHPAFAWQHREEEVRAWLEALGIAKFVFNHANPNGLCVLLRKPER